MEPFVPAEHVRYMRVIKHLAENEQARTRVWLPVECEADAEPDSETKLLSDDE